MERNIKQAKKKYWSQMTSASRRGVEWLFTFHTWWQVWQESGRWEQRGRGLGKYQMCRNGDTGPYSPQNVRIDTHTNNMIEAQTGSKRSDETKQKMSDSWNNERRLQNSLFQKGVKRSPDVVLRMKEGCAKRPRYTCDCCGRVFDAGNYAKHKKKEKQ